MTAPNPNDDIGVAPRAMTSAIREDDSQREELRQSLSRKRKGTTTSDKFFIPPDQIPDGWSYEWKRHTLYNQEDPSYTVEQYEQGWRPVPVSRHPQFMPVGHKGAEILRDGLMLMERPIELTREAMAETDGTAKRQFRDKMAQLQGEGPKFDGMERNKPQISTGYSAPLQGGNGVAVPD